MAVTFVRSIGAKGTNASTVTATLTAAPAQNDLLVACIFIADNTTTISSITQTNVTWNVSTKSVTKVDGTIQQVILCWSELAGAAAGTGVTLTLSALTNATLAVAEFSGFSVSPSSVVQSASNTGTSGNGTVTFATPTVGNLLFACDGMTPNPSTFTTTSSTGWNNISTQLRNGSYESGNNYNIWASGNAVSPVWTHGSAVNWIAAGVELSPTAGNTFSTTVSDSASALDLTTFSTQKAQVDPLSALDVRVTRVNPAAQADTTSAVDGSTRGPGKSLAGDTFSAKDGSTRTPLKAVSETLSALDSLIRQVVASRVEAHSGTDLVPKQVGQAARSEQISATDSVTRLRGSLTTLVDAFSQLDTRVRLVAHVAVDTLAALDVLVRAATTLRTDAGVLFDALAKIPAHTLLDATSALDGVTAQRVANAWQQAITDKTSALDALLGKQIVITKSEGWSSLDTFARTVIATRLVGEVLFGTDSTTHALVKGLSETQLGQDVSARLVGTLRSEAVAQLDSAVRVPLHLLAEHLAGTDSQTRQFLQVHFEQLSSTDKVTAGRVLLLALMDAAGLLDSLGQPQLFKPSGVAALGIITSLVAGACGLTLTLVTGAIPNTPLPNLVVSLLAPPLGVQMAVLSPPLSSILALLPSACGLTLTFRAN